MPARRKAAVHQASQAGEETQATRMQMSEFSG